MSSKQQKKGHAHYTHGPLGSTTLWALLCYYSLSYHRITKMSSAIFNLDSKNKKNNLSA